MAGENAGAGGGSAVATGGAPAAPVQGRIGDDMSAVVDDVSTEPALDSAPELGTDPALEADLGEPIDDGSEAGDDAPLFGLAPAELVAALRNGELPAELIEAVNSMPHDVVVDGQTLKMTVPEMQKAAMRGVTFSRRMQQLAQERQQAQGIIQGDQKRWQTWAKDAGAMFQECDKRGMVDIINETGPLYEIAMHIADQRRQWLSMTAEQKHAHIREQEANKRLADVERREREAEGRERERARGQKAQEFSTRLQADMPKAFAKYQIMATPRIVAAFQGELGAIVDRIPQGQWQGLTAAMIDEAAENVRDMLADEVRRGVTPPTNGAQPRGEPRRPVPPQGADGRFVPRQLSTTPLSGARPAGAPGPTAPKRAVIGDFSDLRGK